MAKYEHFEELPVWQEAARLYNVVLKSLKPDHPLYNSFEARMARGEPVG